MELAVVSMEHVILAKKSFLQGLSKGLLGLNISEGKGLLLVLGPYIYQSTIL